MVKKKVKKGIMKMRVWVQLEIVWRFTRLLNKTGFSKNVFKRGAISETAFKLKS